MNNKKNNLLRIVSGLLIAILLCSLPALAQKKKEKVESEEEPVDQRISTRTGGTETSVRKKQGAKSFEGGKKIHQKTKGKAKVKEIKPTNVFVKEKTWKRQNAYEEAREDPSYGDAQYFGHKKKPKKNPPGKRKLCKECKMVH